MKNPLTKEDLTPKQAEQVATLRAIRGNARKPARSGNPAVSAPAKRALAYVPGAIAAVYLGRSA